VALASPPHSVLVTMVFVVIELLRWAFIQTVSELHGPAWLSRFRLVRSSSSISVLMVIVAYGGCLCSGARSGARN
jgi:hypothetical protein